MNFTLEQVMTELPWTIPARASAQSAHALLRQHHIRHLPVEADGEIIGVLSERDVNLALSLDGKGEQAAVFSLCSKPAYMVDKSEPMALVLRTMAEHGYGSVLVTDRGRLVGIVTTADLMRWMASSLQNEQN